MSLKENLKTKIRLDRMVHKLLSTIREPPAQRWLDKPLVRSLLEMTDFALVKVRDLNLYVRPSIEKITEVLVLDNELAVYRTTVDDVAMRRSPAWQEIFSFRNIKKIMDDKDVILSKGKASLERIYDHVLASLDLSCSRRDLTELLEDARQALALKSPDLLRESLDLFVHLLDFKPIFPGVPTDDLQLFAREVLLEDGGIFTHEHLILFTEDPLSIGLKKGGFSPRDDLDVNWVMQYVRGKKNADLKGMTVFEFLSELALEATKG